MFRALPRPVIWLHLPGYWHPDIAAMLVLRAAGYTQEVTDDAR